MLAWPRSFDHIKQWVYPKEFFLLQWRGQGLELERYVTHYMMSHTTLKNLKVNWYQCLDPEEKVHYLINLNRCKKLSNPTTVVEANLKKKIKYVDAVITFFWCTSKRKGQTSSMLHLTAKKGPAITEYQHYCGEDIFQMLILQELNSLSHGKRTS